jgi:hypothetical protein
MFRRNKSPTSSGKPPAFTLGSCSAYSSTLKMDATCYSGTPVDFQRTIRSYVPEARTFRTTPVRISNPTMCLKWSAALRFFRRKLCINTSTPPWEQLVLDFLIYALYYWYKHSNDIRWRVVYANYMHYREKFASLQLPCNSCTYGYGERRLCGFICASDSIAVCAEILIRLKHLLLNPL